MDHSHRNTELSFRTQGKHLTLDERGQIQALCREGPSLCAIASRVGCAHTTVFNTITADNGPEFSEFATWEKLGTKIYFAHLYSSWERPRNEYHNGMLSEFIPKGASIQKYHTEEILRYVDALNERPKRSLGYHCQEELFDLFLDQMYAMWLGSQVLNLHLQFAIFFCSANSLLMAPQNTSEN